MKIKQLILTVSAILALGSAHGATVPLGVQKNLSFAEVTGNWGWTLNYSNYYGSSDAISTMFAGIGANDLVMIGSRVHGTDVIEVAAAATLAEIQTHTAQNQTHAANGAQWYYNGGSMGFAGLGQEINQSSADINSSSNSGFFPDDGSQRLSWHTSGGNGYDGVPTYVNGGWRSGSHTRLYASTAYDRVIFTMAAVPEPETYGMLLAGLGIMGVLARRRKPA